MTQFSYIIASMAFLLLASPLQASTLKLGSDANTIRTKARSIEAEYSRDMRNSNQQQASDIDQGAHQGALVIDEGSEPAVSAVPETRTYDIQNVPGAGNTYYSSSPVTSSYSYGSNLKMREDRRAGAGFSVGGVNGLAGIILDLNFEDADGVVAGFGTGPGYNSVSLGWKHSFEGDFLTPYVVAGYSRWYNSRGRTTDYADSGILDRVLTDAEKKEGRFGTDFVNGSLGLQYNQLAGEFAGLSFFGELTGMYEIKRSMLLPNGSVGAIYYF